MDCYRPGAVVGEWLLCGIFQFGQMIDYTASESVGLHTSPSPNHEYMSVTLSNVGFYRMLPYIVAAASFLVVVLSLYKELKTSPDDSPTILAVRLHHAGQVVLVVLALWAAIDSKIYSKKAQIARLDAEAVAAAAGHSIAINDKYVLELLPYATVLKNHRSYQQGVQKLPPKVVERFNWERVASAEQKESLVRARQAFAELKRIAREVLNESVMYGAKYPEAMTAWASRTLEVDTDTLPELLSSKPAGKTYAMLVGEATGVSWKKYQDAAALLSQ